MSWEPTIRTRVTSYDISYSATDEDCFDIISVDNTTVSHTFSDLQEGTEYLIIVMAVYESYAIGEDMINIITNSSGNL